jgi:hypothetical protein
MSSRSMNQDAEGCVTGFMCRIDWECELGANCNGNLIFPSIEDLRVAKKCVDSCGIVEVKVYCVRIVEEGAGVR